MVGALKKYFAFCGEKNKRKFYKAIVLNVFSSLALAMKIPAIMVILQAIVNKNLDKRAIFLSLGIMLVGLLVDVLCNRFSTMLQTEAGYDGAAFKRIDMARHLRYLPMGYFNKNSLGSITNVVTNTMESLGDVGTRVVMVTTSGIIDTAIILLLVTIYDYRIGIIGIIGTLVFFFLQYIKQQSTLKISENKVEADREMVTQIIEYLKGIAEVKSFNLYGETSKKLNAAISNSVKSNADAEIKFMPLITLQNIVLRLIGASMIIATAYFYTKETMDAVTAIGMTICSFMIFTSLEKMGTFSSLIKILELCVDKGNEITEIPGMNIEGVDEEPATYDIELNNVAFSYDKRKIIDGINLSIPEKTTTAIVGPSGGGKTTLCNLISRFWDVDSGTITLGGKNIKDYSIDSLMKNFSFVFQNVYLFSDTIANNIRFSNPDSPMEEVIAAAKRACCHDFIMELPDGYETVIGEGGATLSGGEKQRISIARAIMKDSPIIILDEATANVDPENEKDLMYAIDELTKEKTIIMIAHRLKTVRNADQIVVIDQGKIAEQGSHKSLMELDGIYKRFVNAREFAVGWKI